MSEQPSNLAILFVEVVDSSHAPAPVSDAATSAQARDCLSVCQEIAIAHKGRMVRTTRDGAMCEFPDADSAALAACEMQTSVQQDQSGQARGIALRMGLHCGPWITAGVVAQRMALLAASGQIITTGETNALLAARQRNVERQLVLSARAKEEIVTVYEVMWQPDGDHTRMPDRPASIVQEAAVSRLRLIHLGRATVVVTTITMGRRFSHGIELKDPRVSRDHAYIERRQDKFVLVDQSSHGTFIRWQNGEEHKVLRSERVLHGSGVLSFAHPMREAGAELVSFWCESGDVVAPPPRA